MRLETYKMATSILLKFQTLKCDISRTIWRIEVSDSSLFSIFHALSFERNLFFDRTCPLMITHEKNLNIRCLLRNDRSYIFALSDGVSCCMKLQMKTVGEFGMNWYSWSVTRSSLRNRTHSLHIRSCSVAATVGMHLDTVFSSIGAS